MKRFIIALVAVLSVLMPISAKKNQKSNHLVGIWQMCTVDVTGERPKAHFLPYMKSFAEDGTFSNLATSDGSRMSVLTAIGKWKITSDSTYLEIIKRSIFDPGYNGKDCKIKFSFQGPDFLVLKFQTSGGGRWYEEYWVRVVQPKRVGLGSGVKTPTGIDIIKDAVKKQTLLMPQDD